MQNKSNEASGFFGTYFTMQGASSQSDRVFGIYTTGDSSNTGVIALQENGGNVGIGTTDPQGKLDVNGSIRCTSLTQTSDIRFKKNVGTFNNALDRVAELRGVTFQWKDESKTQGQQIGVIAQEVEKVIPEAVSTDDKGYKSVAYNQLVAVLIEAVKELKAENEELRTTLLTVNKELKDRIAALEGANRLAQAVSYATE